MTHEILTLSLCINNTLLKAANGKLDYVLDSVLLEIKGVLYINVLLCDRAPNKVDTGRENGAR
jgi:hypothetical protein